MISSNTIIHFTKTKDALAGILQDNFKIFYCKETFRLNEKNYNARVPMVSFCDIPLSQIREHIDKYGCYGIGLTREWAERNRLNPVLYVDSKSNLAESLVETFKAYIVDAGDDEENDVAQRNLMDILRYMKNFEGKLSRKNKEIEKYRFADEREWRYVPPFAELEAFMTADSSYRKNPEQFDAQTQDLRLNFEPNDIKYIVINTDAEIPEFIRILQDAKGVKYSFADVQRLTTRILTAEQIREDM